MILDFIFLFVFAFLLGWLCGESWEASKAPSSAVRDLGVARGSAPRETPEADL